MPQSQALSSGALQTESETLPIARSARREHIAYLEYFRAVAIVLIVTGHCYAVAWTHFVDEAPLADSINWLSVLMALITGGTAYFVFISGFLYRQVFYERTTYGDFMYKKALYVGLPYVALATPLTLAEMALDGASATLVRHGEAYPRSYFVDFITIFSTGRMDIAYWYIPFIFIVFLASPLFDRFIRLANAQKLAVLGISILIALWVHRPASNLNPAQSVLYFANFYLFGIMFCEYRQPIMNFVSRSGTIAALGLLLVAIAATQVFFLHDSGNLERAAGQGWWPLGLDLMLAQKYAGIAFFCGLLARWGHLAARPLKFLAEISFGLFFIHGIVLAALFRAPRFLSPHFGEPFLDLLLYSAVVLMISIAVVLAARKATGRYSRYIIGC